MHFNQVEKVMLSFKNITMSKEKNYGGNCKGYDFIYNNTNKHRIIAERVAPGTNIAIRGYLWVANLPEYKYKRSKNGHIRFSEIKSEFELVELVKRIILSLE